MIVAFQFAPRTAFMALALLRTLASASRDMEDHYAISVSIKLTVRFDTASLYFNVTI